MRRNYQGPCQLCGREVSLTFHHLIPRKLHRRKRFAKRYSKESMNQGVMICSPCHKGIHKLYTETQLGDELNSLEKLQADSDVKRHVNWVSKQKIR